MTINKLLFRFKLITEEYRELAEAYQNLARGVNKPEEELRILLEKLLKEIVDCVYVLIGTCVDFEWDFDRAFKLVHQANLTKLKGKIEKHKDGKIKKSKTYEPPNLGECI